MTIFSHTTAQHHIRKLSWKRISTEVSQPLTAGLGKAGCCGVEEANCVDLGFDLLLWSIILKRNWLILITPQMGKSRVRDSPALAASHFPNPRGLVSLSRSPCPALLHYLCPPSSLTSFREPVFSQQQLISADHFRDTENVTWPHCPLQKALSQNSLLTLLTRLCIIFS